MLRRHQRRLAAHRDGLRHQQGLLLDADVHLRLEALVEDALVGRVHVHHHQTVGVLRQHVGPVQQRQRVAEGRYIAGGGGGRFDRVSRVSCQRSGESGSVAEGGTPRWRQRRIGGPSGRWRTVGKVQRHALLHAPAERRQTRVGRWRHRRCASARRHRHRQRLMNRMKHQAVERLAVAKTHLGLGRMHVDVHPRRVDADKQHARRVEPTVEDVAVGLADGMCQHPVAHEAAIYEGELRVLLRGQLWTKRNTVHAHTRGLHLERQSRLAKGITQ